jgi:hypothetical protein
MQPPCTGVTIWSFNDAIAYPLRQGMFEDVDDFGVRIDQGITGKNHTLCVRRFRQ